jgi:hypothetical protein
MGMDGQETPLLTPTAIDEEGARFDFSASSASKSKKAGVEKSVTDEVLREARAKFVKRRRAELARRASEVLLLVVIGMFVLGNEVVRSSIQPWHRGQYTKENTQAVNCWLIEMCSRTCEPCHHYLSAVPALSNPSNSLCVEEDQIMEAHSEDHTASCRI